MNKSFNFLFIFFLIVSNILADDIPNFTPELSYESNNSVDCIILKDENSIICKYIHTRSSEDKKVEFIWIDPDGEISRQRTMLIPAGHGSIYDYRFINGRVTGKWTLEVLDNNKSFTTNFIIE
jgi:hypothetical protein